jgi:WD40 repeat protein
MQRFEKVNGEITGLAWAPDGGELLATYQNGMTVARCDTRRGTFRLWNPSADHPVTSVAFSPDGRWLAVGSDAGLVLPYDAATDNYDVEFHPGEPFGMRVPVHALAWAPRTRGVLATASLGVQLWTADEEEGTIALTGDDVYTALAWSDEESWLAAANADAGVVEVHRLNDRITWAYEVFSADHGGEPSLSIAPRGTRERMTLAAVSGRGVVLHTVERERGFTSSRRIAEREPGPILVAFHPGGSFLATAGDDGLVRYWDPRTGRELQRCDGKIGTVLALAFAPDGMRCAAGGSSGAVVVWDVDV